MLCCSHFSNCKRGYLSCVSNRAKSRTMNVKVKAKTPERKKEKKEKRTRRKNRNKLGSKFVFMLSGLAPWMFSICFKSVHPIRVLHNVLRMVCTQITCLKYHIRKKKSFVLALTEIFNFQLNFYISPSLFKVFFYM